MRQQKWDAWVIDYLEMTCEVVLESIPLEDANDFTSSWVEPDSLAIGLPVGFRLFGIPNSETCQASGG